MEDKLKIDLPAIALRRQLQAGNGELRKKRKKTFNSQGGQTILIAVLIIVVVLTVGLSVAARSITNVKTTTDEERSQKAFSAAESGVEQALRKGCVAPTGSMCEAVTTSFSDPVTGIVANSNTTIRQIGGTTEVKLNDGGTISRDEGVEIWLSDYSSNQSEIFKNNRWDGLNFTIYWGDFANATACEHAAIEVVIMTGDKNNPSVLRRAYDPCTRTSPNGFYNVGSLVNPQGGICDGYRYATNLVPTGLTPPQHIRSDYFTTPPNPGLIARVIPYYKDTKICISGSKAFPSQGTVIDSVGKSGDAVRRISTFKGNPQLPVEFYYSAFVTYP